MTEVASNPGCAEIPNEIEPFTLRLRSAEDPVVVLGELPNVIIIGDGKLKSMAFDVALGLGGGQGTRSRGCGEGPEGGGEGLGMHVE